jgi:hypothetical protein
LALKYVSGVMTWAADNNTVYTAGNGLVLAGNEFSIATTGANPGYVLKYDGENLVWGDAGAGSGHTGTGTANTIPLWDGPVALGDSVLTQKAGNIGVSSATPGAKLDVNGSLRATSITGDGSALTNLNASAIVDGTVSAARVQDVWVNADGDTMSGALNMGNFAVTNLATPSANSDAATKAYVDSMIGSTGTITQVVAGSGLSGGGSSGAITLGVANNGILSTMLGNAAVTGAKLAADSVSSDKILDATITGADVAAGTISGSHMVVNTIDFAQMKDTMTMDNDLLISGGYAIGVGAAPAAGVKFDVNGKVKATALQVTTGAGNGLVMTSDANGNALWQSLGSLGSGGDITDVLAGNGIAVLNGSGPQPTLSIANAGVTSAMMANASVTTAAIVDAAVNGTKIADNAVDTTKITDGTIVNADIAASASITGDRLADDTINADKLADTLSLDADMVFAGNHNIGIGSAVPGAKLDVNGKVRTTQLQITDGAGSGLIMTSDANGNALWQTIAAVGGGETNTASNIGLQGVGVYASKSGVDLQFKNIASTSSLLTVTDNTTDDTIDLTLKNDIADAAWNWTNVSATQLKVGTLTQGYDTDLADLADGQLTASKVEDVWVNATGDTMSGLLALPSNGLTVGGSQLVVVGGNIGIGSGTPATKLDVAGTVKATGLTLPTGAAANKVLTSDANGAATWQSLGTLGGGGDVTGVEAGAGLVGGGTAGDLTLSIGAGNIVSTMLAANAVTTEALLDLNVTGAKLAADAVTAAKVLDGTLTAADLSSSAGIVGGQLAANTVNGTQLANTLVLDSALTFDASGSNFGMTFDPAGNTLVIDSANNRVGIGLTNPSVPLDVAGAVKATGLSLGANGLSIGGG